VIRLALHRTRPSLLVRPALVAATVSEYGVLHRKSGFLRLLGVEAAPTQLQDAVSHGA
jgi:hypothetical protein